jgi:hypothetical protein
MKGLMSGFSRVRDLAAVLIRRPYYLLGRITLIRDLYSKLNFLSDRVAGPAPLKIGDLYQGVTSTLDVAPSGFVVSDKSAGQQCEELNAHSYSVGPRLNEEGIEALRKIATTYPLRPAQTRPGSLVYADFSETSELRQRVPYATIYKSSRIDVVRALAGDAQIFEAASRFLGYRPRLVSTWFFWSLANNLSDDLRRHYTQTIDYHYDVDGYKFVYANFYVNDTTIRNGAHKLVAGSGRRKRLRNLFKASLTDDEARQAYGAAAERAIEGPAGFGFLEDTSCYHKALPPLEGDRLMLQLRYQ